MKIRFSSFFLLTIFVVFISCTKQKLNNLKHEEIKEKSKEGANLFLEGDEKGNVLLNEVWQYFVENQELAMKDPDYGKAKASKTEITMLMGIFSGYITGELTEYNMDSYPYIKNIESKNPQFHTFIYKVLSQVSPEEIAEMIINGMIVLKIKK